MKNASEIKPVLIGTGVLTWNASERRSDRYGSVWLTVSPQSDTPVSLEPVEGWGCLCVRILETRHSPHIGDFFRGFFPETPRVGDEFPLGVGQVFHDAGAIGLDPQDGRGSDWLDPQALYRAHNQTVELLFERRGRR